MKRNGRSQRDPASKQDRKCEVTPESCLLTVVTPPLQHGALCTCLYTHVPTPHFSPLLCLPRVSCRVLSPPPILQPSALEAAQGCPCRAHLKLLVQSLSHTHLLCDIPLSFYTGTTSLCFSLPCDWWSTRLDRRFPTDEPDEGAGV